MAQHTGTSQDSKAARGKAPISRHPLFPAIVALWFGALFGLGSLAIRPGLLESVVVATHIDLLIPAAAPPLGLTARILLALALAGTGGAIGASLARRIGRPKSAPRQRQREALAPDAQSRAAKPDAAAFRSRDSHPDAPARQPISARDELGTDSTKPRAEGEGTMATRRRSLTMDETYEPEFAVEMAPLPGSQPKVLDLSAICLADPIAEPDDDAGFDYEVFATENRHESEAEDGAHDSTGPFGEIAGPEALIGTAARIFDAPAHPDPAPSINHAAEPVADLAIPADHPLIVPTGSAAERIVAAPVDTLGPVELVERLALSLQRKRELAAAASALALQAAQALAEAEASAPAEAETGLSTIVPSALTKPRAAPIRFGAPFVADDAAVQVAMPADEPPALPQSMPLPAALRPIALDEDFGDELPDFLPPRTIRPHAAPDGEVLELDGFAEDGPDLHDDSAQQLALAMPADEPEDALDENQLEDGYSSLLGISRPAPTRQPFLRIEEPVCEDQAAEPVVIFPGQAARRLALEDFAQSPASPRRFDAPESAGDAPRPHALSASLNQDPTESERALRAALATLQRMSGAA